MMLGRFARRLLSFVVIVGVLGWSLWAAADGLLGIEAQDWVRACRSDLQDCSTATRIVLGFIAEQLTRLFDAVIERLKPHLHSLIALGSLSFGIWKWIKYREAALLGRLKELVEREVVDLRVGRSDLINIVCRPSPGQSATAPLYSDQRLRSLLLRRSWRSVVYANPMTKVDRQLNRALVDIQKQLDWTGLREAHFREQRATIHLIKGAIASARTESAKTAQRAWSFNKDALAHFRNVLHEQNGGNDIDATEFCGHQLWRLGALDEALVQYQRMEELAEQVDPVKERERRGKTLARAKRYQAEIHHLQGAHGTANNLLSSALDDDLEPLAPLVNRDLLEQAQTNELQANVRRHGLGFTNAAKESLQSAEADYQRLKEELDPAKQSSLRRAITRAKRLFRDDGVAELRKAAEEGLARVQLALREYDGD
jgi:hypothetical protein